MSPELIDPPRFGFKGSHPTKHSDCYALGMVIYETISGQLPFHQYMNLAVFVKVLEGERPLRGAEFTSSLWETLELCWASQPNDRPNIEEVLRCLETLLKFSESPSPREDEEMEACDGCNPTDGSASVGYNRNAGPGSPSRPPSNSIPKPTPKNTTATNTTNIALPADNSALPPKNSAQQGSGHHLRRTLARAIKNLKTFFLNKFKLGPRKGKEKGASKEKILQLGPLPDWPLRR